MTTFTEYLWFNTRSRREFINITPKVKEFVERGGIKEGFVLVSAMHITSAVYFNDTEDGLIEDINEWLDILAPYKPDYKHHQAGENNESFAVPAGCKSGLYVLSIESGSGRLCKKLMID